MGVAQPVPKPSISTTAALYPGAFTAVRHAKRKSLSRCAIRARSGSFVLYDGSRRQIAYAYVVAVAPENRTLEDVRESANDGVCHCETSPFCRRRRFSGRGLKKWLSAAFHKYALVLTEATPRGRGSERSRTRLASGIPIR